MGGEYSTHGKMRQAYGDISSSVKGEEFLTSLAIISLVRTLLHGVRKEL
jgi:hypothetical protein